MFVRQLESACEILAPAKINLSLDVLSRRADGFHEIETLITPISIFDTLRAQRTDTGEIRLKVNSTGFVRDEPPLPGGSDNLVVNAVEQLKAELSDHDSELAASNHPAIDSLGISLTLTKRIPSAAGLGGGSSDAAAALVAANLVWDLRLTTTQLQSVAAKIGSDVPAFLAKASVLCAGRGEQIKRDVPLTRLQLVLVKPPVSLSTPQVYSQCEPGGQATDWPQSSAFDVRQVAALMSNDLQTPAENLTEWIVRLGQVFRAQDLIAHQMSGSGSTYFGICRHAAHAVRVASRLKNLGIGQVFLATSIAG